MPPKSKITKTNEVGSEINQEPNPEPKPNLSQTCEERDRG